MSINAFTSFFLEQAVSQGIDLIGITSAKPFITKDESRTIIDPKELLPNARAVIVTAFYSNEKGDPAMFDINHPRGKYAFDQSIRSCRPMENFYFQQIQSILGKLGYEVINNRDNRIPEKMAAARAGIGKYGKSTVIITKKYGSFVRLVSFVTNAPLEYEDHELYESDCGKCEVCIKICPTNAIYEPFHLKKELCISDWLWGSYVPINLREKQENRIFGCGECVRLCPRNRRLTTREKYPVELEDVSLAPELIPLLTGDYEYYQKTIASFPLSAGIESIRGNSIIALGNLKYKSPSSHFSPHLHTQNHKSGHIQPGRLAGLVENMLKKCL